MADDETQQRRFAVGYALAPKKQRSFIQDSLLSLARSRGVDLLPIDAAAPLSDQGPFDLVLHKLHGRDWRLQLEAFAAKHPSALLVDPPDAIERLHNRISMLQVVSELTVAAGVRGETFGIPDQIVVLDAESLASGGAGLAAMKFPVIAKPLVADGSAKSHKMALVYSREGLRELKPPVVLQEFVNHGGVIFKVYVAGAYVNCVKRKSLPDVGAAGAESEAGGLLSFSQVSNLAVNERTDDKYYKKMRLDEAEMPPSGFLEDIAGGLRKALRLNLFNFDVIRDSRFGNRYLIIDINYFPGYAKMPGYERVLTEFFCDMRAKKLLLMQGREEAKDEEKEESVGCCGDGDDGVLPVSPRSREDENPFRV